ncbi:DUF423 domain-containing protein [Thermoflexibacter ruber]|uniref:Uncharacterized membrane protein YgdD, TMEM256/DUF423 family n=1 Tax=Thermoflexibacter ruber TaxID=1003 RepID=A0A1I2GUE5_9BACT|nr:DUF423 domain-containing protein [Thermoflexibacter ruber]SFF20447.1 Uncharacterized membrane protein YgdD, TMEM256/DUF423 family [Thermoflexibacter ruber]
MQKKFIMLGAILAMLGVMIGAFGAHALKPILEANSRVDTFETAVKYHFYHALGLLFIGLFSHRQPSKWLSYAGNCLLAGVIIFSGSLYALCLSGITFLGAITPIGGVCMIAGWFLVVVAVIKRVE